MTNARTQCSKRRQTLRGRIEARELRSRGRDPSETTLISSWKAGDPSAAEALVASHYALVLEFFERRTSTPEDFTQRTFLAAIEGRDRFRGEGPFRSYVFTIARRLLTHAWRAEIQEATCRRTILGTPVVQAEPEPLVLLSREQEYGILRRHIRGLGDLDKTVLNLHYWMGLTAREIGTRLQMPTSSVTTRLARARNRLREQFRDTSRPARPMLVTEQDAHTSSPSSQAPHESRVRSTTQRQHRGAPSRLAIS